jgi:DHA1 family inner membrane transport protein
MNAAARSELSASDMPLALYAVVIATAAIGTMEVVVVGFIPDIAADMNVSIPIASFLLIL